MDNTKASNSVEEASGLVDACTSIRRTSDDQGTQRREERSCRSRCDLSYAAFREYADIKKKKSEIEKTKSST